MGARIHAIACAAATSCYAPHAQPGSQCTSGGDCPSGLACMNGVCNEPGSPEDAPPPGTDVRRDAPPDVPPNKFAIRIDVAGPAFTGVDHPGSWLADPGAGGICNGTQFDSPTPTLNGTNDSTLFVNQMFAPMLACAIGGIPAGTYAAKLLFAELRLGGAPCTGPVASQRVFDIAIEGTTVKVGFDATTFGGGCAASGGPGHAFDLAFTVAVNDGTFDLVETASMGTAILDAVELVQQ